MKQVIAFGIMTILMLFSFQNCQKTPFPDEMTAQNLQSSVANNKVDLKNESIESVNFLIEENKTVQQAGHTYQVKYLKNLQIDLGTGIILESSDVDTNTENYCLTDELKSELIILLSSSQVCTTQPDIPANTLCTQVMKMPYAQVLTDKQQYNLGSATDGCGSNSVDLCDEQANLLKGYLQSLKQKYKQLSCQ